MLSLWLLLCSALSLQKQPPEVFYKKVVPKISVLEYFLLKLQDLGPTTLLKRDSKHICFPVNIAKFLRTPTLRNICEWLFLVLLNVFISGLFCLAKFNPIINGVVGWFPPPYPHQKKLVTVKSLAYLIFHEPKIHIYLFTENLKLFIARVGQISATWKQWNCAFYLKNRFSSISFQ